MEMQRISTGRGFDTTRMCQLSRLSPSALVPCISFNALSSLSFVPGSSFVLQAVALSGTYSELSYPKKFSPTVFLHGLGVATENGERERMRKWVWSYKEAQKPRCTEGGRGERRGRRLLAVACIMLSLPTHELEGCCSPVYQ